MEKEMTTGTIIIDDNKNVTFRPGPDNDVWLTQYEIARLFKVFVPAVTANIKAIYKSGALKEYDTMCILSTDPKTGVIVYNMEMIAALAFRIDSWHTKVFRSWLTHRPKQHMVVVRVPSNEQAIVN